MEKLAWKDEKAMIKQDVELHLEWHKRLFHYIPEVKGMTIKQFTKYAPRNHFVDYYFTGQSISFGYNGCRFNIFDSASALSKFHQGLCKRV